MRILNAFATVSLLLAFSCSQTEGQEIRIDTATHHCEGDANWSTPACETSWQPGISAIFLGRVTEVRNEDVHIILDGERTLTGRLHVTFRVEESFRGVPQKNVTVISGGDLCGFPFSKGMSYLVYGRHLPSGEIYVSIGSATKWKKEAAKDLQYLRGLSQVPHGATIFGSVARFTSPVNPSKCSIRRAISPTGQKIQIRGQDQTYEVTVDAQGKFKLAALPPGPYTILLKPADNSPVYSIPKSTTVNVSDKACSEFRFWIDPFATNDSNNAIQSDVPATSKPLESNHP